MNITNFNGHNVLKVGMEDHPFFPRFPAASVVAQSSSNLYHPPTPPVSQATSMVSRMTFPQVQTIQHSPQSMAKATTTKGASDNRLRLNEENTAVVSANSAPPGIVHNTLRKTKSDMKVIHRYLVQVKNDTREIHEIPPQDLCGYVQVGGIVKESVAFNLASKITFVIVGLYCHS